MSGNNSTPDSDSSVPKWLKTLVYAIPLITFLWIAYTNIRDFNKTMLDSNAKQAKDLKDLSIQQAKEITEQQRERTNQEKYRLEGERTKTENIKLAISQKEIEKSIQSESIKSAQELTHQREVEFRRDKLEIEAGLIKEREITKRDSLRIVSNKIEAEKEDKKSLKEKVALILKNVEILNSNAGNLDYISAINNISIIREDIPIMPGNYYFAYLDALINRLRQTQSQAEIALIEEKLLYSDVTNNIDSERFDQLLEINKSCNNLIQENLSFLIYNNEFDGSARDDKITSYNINLNPYRMTLNYMNLPDLMYLIGRSVDHLNNLGKHRKRYELPDKSKLNDKNKEVENSLKLNMYKLSRVSHVILSKSIFFTDFLNDGNTKEILFLTSSRKDWSALNPKYICPLIAGSLHNIYMCRELHDSIVKDLRCK